MALPRVQKDMILYNAGKSYLGECGSVTPPKLARKLEEWRGAGMDSPVKLDMGGEAMEMEFSCGGPMRDVVAQFAATSIGEVMLRFVGAFQNDETGAYTSIEITVRGRHEEIDRGEWKPGEQGEFKVKSQLSYYREDWDGVTMIEADPINSVLVVNGVDRLADRRAALGI